MKLSLGVGILTCLISSNVCWSMTIQEQSEESGTDETVKQVIELLKSEESADRIVNGRKANYGEYPWMVSLYEFGGFFCGGSIYNERYIITAAHCLEGSVSNFLQVRAGDHALRGRDEFEQRVGVRKIIMHPRYRSDDPIKFDIAILMLKNRLEFNDYVKKIELPSTALEVTLAKRNRCWLSGFGTISDNGSVDPNVLMEVRSTLRGRKYCKNTVQSRFPEENFSKYFICSFNSGKGGCYGDSGSAYICYDNDGTPYQVGVLSWGPFSCLDGLNLYSRISTLKNWISKNAS